MGFEEGGEHGAVAAEEAAAAAPTKPDGQGRSSQSASSAPQSIVLAANETSEAALAQEVQQLQAATMLSLLV